MSKDSAFIGVGFAPSFEFTSDAVYCYACIFRLEKMSGNPDISIASLLSFFGIDWNKVKTTRTGDFCQIKEEDVSDIVDKYHHAKGIYLKCLELPIEEAIKELVYSKTNNTDSYKIAALADVIEAKEKHSKVMVPERLFKLVFFSRKFDKSRFHSELLLMSDECCDLKLPSFFSGRTLKNLLFLLDLSTFGDLINRRIDFVYPLFIDNYEYILNIIKSFDGNPFKDFKNETDNLIQKISEKNPRGLEVFRKRNCIGYSIRMTLEEVGEQYKLTRERIRQIEAKTKEQIIKYGKTINRIILTILLSCLKQNNYVSKAYLSDKFEDSIYADYLCAFVECFFNGDFEYDEYLQCFLKKGYIANIEEELTSEHPLVVTMDDYMHFDSVKKNMVQKLYNLKKGSVYIRKGASFSDFVLMAFDELFPNGGRISEENCLTISNYLKEKYDVDVELAPHNLQTYLARSNYCFVDRGTFINRKYAASISEELAQRIISHILSLNTLVYYSQIFALYKDEFLNNNITNWFYVKGVLDPLLPANIRTKKDYCCKTSYDGNVSTHFEDLFRNHNGILTLDVFLEENPGVKDYVLFNYANNNLDKILWLSNKTFIHVDYIYIPKTATVLIKEEANNIFTALNTDVITDSKLYVRVKHSYPDLLLSMPYIQNAFDLYSLTRYLLSDCFYYSRPFISKTKENISYARVIRNYLLTLDRFDLHILQSYCSRMHLRIYNYLDLLIDMSDEFVQITKDCCINKRVFVIKHDELEELKDCLEYYINSFGEMDLRRFNGYSIFPKLKYQWNQYLLVGIITSYLSDLFEIEYTDNQYTLTSYIIRRR